MPVYFFFSNGIILPYFTTSDKVLQTQTYYFHENDITKVKLLARQTTPTNTSIAWEISTDGGTTFENITINEITTLTNQGKELVLKATLNSSDGIYSPQILCFGLQKECIET